MADQKNLMAKKEIAAGVVHKVPLQMLTFRKTQHGSRILFNAVNRLHDYLPGAAFDLNHFYREQPPADADAVSEFTC